MPAGGPRRHQLTPSLFGQETLLACSVVPAWGGPQHAGRARHHPQGSIVPSAPMTSVSGGLLPCVTRSAGSSGLHTWSHTLSCQGGPERDSVGHGHPARTLTSQTAREGAGWHLGCAGLQATGARRPRTGRPHPLTLTPCGNPSTPPAPPHPLTAPSLCWPGGPRCPFGLTTGQT